MISRDVRDMIMNTNTQNLDKIIYPRVKEVPGLVLRSFRGEEDYPKMLAVLYGCAGNLKISPIPIAIYIIVILTQICSLQRSMEK
jgi:hypothetical protein